METVATLERSWLHSIGVVLCARAKPNAYRRIIAEQCRAASCAHLVGVGAGAPWPNFTRWSHVGSHGVLRCRHDLCRVCACGACCGGRLMLASKCVLAMDVNDLSVRHRLRLYYPLSPPLHPRPSPGLSKAPLASRRLPPGLA